MGHSGHAILCFYFSSFPAPTGLAAPSVRFTPPATALVTFSPPSSGNGLVTQYQLLVYAVAVFSEGYNASQPSPSQPTSVLSLSRGVFSASIDNLLSAHRYEVRVAASTSGGTTSSPGSQFTTPEAGKKLLLVVCLYSHTTIIFVLSPIDSWRTSV